MDPYEILGVSKTATVKEIKKAYKAKVKQYHPDKEKDPFKKDMMEHAMKKLNEAYKVLINGEDENKSSEEKELTIEEQALRMVNSIVLQVVMDKHTTYKNFYNRVINEVTSSWNQCAEEIKTLETELNRLEEIKEHRCLNSKEKYLKSIISEEINNINNRINNLKNIQLPTHKECTKQLEAFYFCKKYDEQDYASTFSINSIINLPIT